jgi:phage terminase small subunit|tara:strand:- start:211 stop:699 length:489 start_codon:yes stop_codon:yes gene_type:complete
MTKRLTLKQLRFVNEYVSNDGQITATEAAKRAGYGESRATVTASELLNPQKHPEVVRYIDEMKKEMQHKTAVTYDRHVSRLDELSRKAEEKNAWSAAVQAEKNRGQAAGFYNHAQNIHVVNSIDSMSLDQVQSRLKDIRKLYGDIIDADFTEVKEIEQKKEG